MTVKITVLYDGWPLVYRPNSPAALHLLALLAARPDEVEAVVAMPGVPPDWWRGGASLHVLAASDTPRGRLEWQQRRIPALARKLDADLVHLTASTPALFSTVPCLVSPSDYPHGQDSRSGISRLREALAEGGMRGLKALLWPADWPPPLGVGDLPPHPEGPLGHMSSFLRLPPIAFAALLPNLGGTPADIVTLDLPESFILYHGPHAESDLRRLLAAWSWAAESIGVSYPLLLLGLDDPARERLKFLAGEVGLLETLHLLPGLSPFSIPWLYQRCTVLFHPAPISPWGDPVRQALTFGKPVVACESPEVSAVVGPAAYLASEEDTRQQGAALISVVINEEVAEQLSAFAFQRAAGWLIDEFLRGLLQAYLLARR